MTNLEAWSYLYRILVCLVKAIQNELNVSPVARLNIQDMCICVGIHVCPCGCVHLLSCVLFFGCSWAGMKKKRNGRIQTGF